MTPSMSASKPILTAEIFVARVAGSKWSKPKRFELQSSKVRLDDAVASTLGLPRREQKKLRIFVSLPGIELALDGTGAQQLAELCEQQEYADLVHLSAIVDGSDFLRAEARAEAHRLQHTVTEQLAAAAEQTLEVKTDSSSTGPAKEPTSPVLFWRDGDSNSYLSNWHKSPITIDGKKFTCVEQYYMWSKAELFGDHNVAASILSSTDPPKMKKLGRSVRGFKPAKWRKHQPIVLLEGNRAKFRDHPELARRLLRTGSRPIAEASPSDSICGIGLGPLDSRAQDPKQWKGLNLLGQALEKVREEIRDTSQFGLES